jgi:putative sigma-54 modulation protein
MQIDILSSGLLLTDAIKSYVGEKIGRLEHFLKRVPQDSILVRVEVSKTTQHHEKGKVFRAEARITLPGKDLYAHTVEEDLYAAIDIMCDELKRQILDFKDRRLTARRRNP